MSSLAAVPALRSLVPDALDVLLQRSREVHFPAGTMLRAAGESPQCVTFLLSGTVVATHSTPSGIPVWPARWAGPAVVDKAALLGGEVPVTGLMALTAASTRLLPTAEFLDLLEREPPVRKHVLAQLARDAMTDQRRLIQVATLPALTHLAVWLGEQNPDHPVAWRGSQEQLGSLLGRSRVTVNRALAQLIRAGAVKLTAHGLVVADRDRLSTFAQE
jgi:CRP/FNR family cyclic AMP-dependent transcriptional regulator